MNKLVIYLPEEIFISEPTETYVLRVIQWKTSYFLLLFFIIIKDVITDTDANYTVSFSSDIAFFK